MLTLEYISARGDVLPLSANPLFTLAEVDGQTIGEAKVSTAKVSGADGETVNSVQADARSIVLDLRINSGVNVEEAKRAILRVVKFKQKGRLVWTQSDRTVTIAGTVESVELPRWKSETTLQITMFCGQPYWEDVDDVVQQISEAINLHYFTDSPANMLYFPEDGIPFGEYDTIRTKSFYNDGDVDVGLEITLLAHGKVTNPIINARDGQFFGVGYETNPLVMEAGDNVIITTHKGNKTVTHNGVAIFDKIKPQSTWLTLAPGDNQFSIDSDDESISNMSFSLIYRQRYI